MEDRLQSGDCARYLKALADADRLKIVQVLLSGPRYVGEIAEELKMEMVNASHHLSVLRNANLVLSEKEGRYVRYSLHPNYYRPSAAKTPDCLDLGCCRVELTGTAE